ALVWAIAGLAFYGDTAALSGALADGGPSGVVYDIATTVAGPVGGVIAVVGVIVCPITSGDTALRAARLMVEDDRNKGHDEKKISLAIVSVMLIFVIILCLLDFSVLWNYFSWLNQTLATVVLWTATVFILKVLKKKWYSLITMLPAMFMTMIVTSFILHSKLGPSLDHSISVTIGVLVAVFAFILYLRVLINSEES
ncbi:MAG: hypothetical protein J5673_04050, partial [Candidatus Methanomethylophilaceae archaeon]|nr:hypothetical protein [Candidatus Methanomethylophilaceae archaeon]